MRSPAPACSARPGSRTPLAAGGCPRRAAPRCPASDSDFAIRRPRYSATGTNRSELATVPAQARRIEGHLELAEREAPGRRLQRVTSSPADRLCRERRDCSRSAACRSRGSRDRRRTVRPIRKEEGVGVRARRLGSRWACPSGCARRPWLGRARSSHRPTGLASDGLAHEAPHRLSSGVVLVARQKIEAVERTMRVGLRSCSRLDSAKLRQLTLRRLRTIRFTLTGLAQPAPATATGARAPRIAPPSSLQCYGAAQNPSPPIFEELHRGLTRCACEL